MSHIINPFRFGGAAFSPDDIAGLLVWLKADAITGLNDGDAVATWGDSSSNANDFTQGVAGNRPTYQTNEVNSLPVVRFDGTSDHLISGASVTMKPVTAFFVTKAQDFSASRTLLSQNSGWHNRFNIATGRHNLDKYATAVIGTATTGNNNLGAWTINTVTYSGSGEYVFYFNTAADGSGTNDQTLTANVLYLGASPVSAECFALDIAEVILYDSVLSSGDRGSVETYLTDKYAL